MNIVLIAGLWLPSSVWADTAAELEALGHRAVAVELPGVDDASVTAVLDDQLDAVLRVVDGADRPLVVGHSAAATLAWLVADRRPEKVAGVAMIGGFPAASGSTYAEFFDIVDGAMPFPGWEPFEGPDAADLDEVARQHLADRAIAVPRGVATGVVEYCDDRRFAVPVTLVCPEFTPDDARSWLADGAVPELDRVERLEMVDADSGHWPMITRPGELARLLADAVDAGGAEPRGSA